ncbi:unnamed protein product, partial [Laminaria digitata]
GRHLRSSRQRYMGVPAKLPSVHIVDAYSGATVPRANSRPGTRNVPPVANVRAKPAFSFLHPSEWSQNDERAPQGHEGKSSGFLLQHR